MFFSEQSTVTLSLIPAKLPSVLLQEFYSLQGTASLDKNLTPMATECNLSTEEV